MPNKRTARLIPSGNSSFVVVLPRDWIRGNELEKRREVEMTYDDEEITIRKPARSRG